MFINKRSIPPILRLSEKQCARIIERKIKGIREHFEESEFSQAVIGLSGGIDSAAVIALACKALGPENVTAIRLPFGNLNGESMKIAEEIARSVGLPEKNLLTHDITEQVLASWHALEASFPPALLPKEREIRFGNVAARTRMMVLMDACTNKRAILLGTENKTEELLGYFTIGGDNISHIEPIQNLWKTQVFQIGEALELPASVLDRAPSAELWHDQTDEGEMGFSYLQADIVLACLEKYGKIEHWVETHGVPRKTAEEIQKTTERQAWKRKCPVVIR